MSGETEAMVSGWTIDTWRYHSDAMRNLERLWREDQVKLTEKFEQERDRRLGEVAVEREKALKIKETADLAALSLAREIQDYKDEKANGLRDQLLQERGSYATKADVQSAVREVSASISPLVDKLSDLSTAMRDQYDTLRREHNADVLTLRTEQSLNTGRDRGIATSWAALLAVIGAALGAGAFIHSFVK
jgi:hypothetical protein